MLVKELHVLLLVIQKKISNVKLIIFQKYIIFIKLYKNNILINITCINQLTAVDTLSKGLAIIIAKFVEKLIRRQIWQEDFILSVKQNVNAVDAILFLIKTRFIKEEVIQTIVNYKDNLMTRG